MKKIAYAFLTAAMAGGMALGTGGVASAAHCVEDGEPGFSYFGQDGREKGAPKGASSCNDDGNPSPSERAPGKNR